MSLSFQLYSARNFTPWENVLATLARIGYTQVEGFGDNFADASAFRSAMDVNGLRMPTAHFGIDLLEQDLDGVFATAKTLGVSKIVCPYLLPEERPTDSVGWKAIAERLGAIDANVRQAGFSFAWHNHDFEFTACSDDGSIPMAIILDTVPSLEWEADIAWVVRGDADPLEWIERYGSRISVAHAKDIAVQGECTDEDGWADFGHGVMNWQAIYPALRAAGTELFVAEHDNPNDFERFATRAFQSYQNMQP